MKTILSVLALGSFLAAPLLTQAGVGAGGGGNAVVCMAADGSIQFATSVDLYEGYVVNGFSAESSALPYKEQAILRAKEIGKGLDLDLDGLVERTVDSVRFLPRGTALTPVKDASYLFQPAQNCQITQLAHYVDRNDNLLVNEEVWEKLSETDKAALVVHETLYAYLRAFGAKTSDQVRHTVAVAFSGAKFENTFDGAPEDAETCTSLENDSTFYFPSTSFVIYKTSAGKVAAQFQSLDNRLMVSKTVFEFVVAPALPLAKGQREESWHMDQLSSITENGTKVAIELVKRNAKLTGYIRTGSLNEAKAFVCAK